jgi:hypothetical protein
MSINYEIDRPVDDDMMVESVAIAMWKAHRHPLDWRTVPASVRERKRTEARAAITVVIQYLICLESIHGDHC